MSHFSSSLASKAGGLFSVIIGFQAAFAGHFAQKTKAIGFWRTGTPVENAKYIQGESAAMFGTVILLVGVLLVIFGGITFFKHRGQRLLDGDVLIALVLIAVGTMYLFMGSS